MSSAAAGSMFMWLSGILVGIGVASDSRLAAVGGILLSMIAVCYIRRFVENVSED